MKNLVKYLKWSESHIKNLNLDSAYEEWRDFCLFERRCFSVSSRTAQRPFDPRGPFCRTSAEFCLTK